MRSRFDAELMLLNKEMIEMGALCEDAIQMVAQALTDRERNVSAKLAPIAMGIDQMERDIETRCLKLLLQQQPVARDLRQISAALKMITDMERIGDQAEDIAEIITFLDGRTVDHSVHIQEMAKEIIKMVTSSVDAYVNKDLELARRVIEQDDVIDEYFIKGKSTLIDVIAKQPDDGEYALDLLMITKYFERIGDHATNIAEWVIFSVTGEHKEG